MDKRILLAGWIFLLAGSVSASTNGGAPGMLTDCSDPRTMSRFSLESDANAYCLPLSNDYVRIGTTFDYGYGKYTCSCENNNENHGG